jgi:hypothetical protein
MEFTLTDEGKMLNINISGKGKYVHSIQYGGLAVPSLVLPHNSGQLKDIKIILGEPALPYVSDINSILDSCSYNEKLKTLSVSLKAFPGHRSEVEIISPFKPQSILKENQIIKDWNAVEENNVYLIKINIVHNNEVENLNIQF